MNKITWNNLLRTFSFTDELRSKLKVLNALRMQAGIMKEPLEVSDFGTASWREEMDDSDRGDYILANIDNEIERLSNEINRTVITPTPKWGRDYYQN